MDTDFQLPADLTDLEDDRLSAIQQYVSFLVHDEIFAFSIDMVQEIIRVPELARVPMASASMLGLANLRGEILPVFDLRKMLGAARKDINDASRVIVVDDGVRLGLVVDRVAEVLNVPKERIEDAGTVDKAIGSSLLTGVVKNFASHDLVQLFNPSSLPELSASKLRHESERMQSIGQSSMALRSGSEDNFEADEDVLQIVSLQMGDEEYAFNLADVDEIVRVPAHISEVPNAPSRVVGLTTLRDRVLPILSLRECLAMPGIEAKDSNRVVVLQLPDGAAGMRHFGVIVDRVREVLRVPRHYVDEVPEGIRKQGANEIECICKLDKGNRLISVLSAGECIGGIDLDMGNVGPAEDTDKFAEVSSMHPDEEGAVNEDIQFVVFKLAREDFGINIHAVQEIIRLPEHFVAVPNADAEIEGIINLRGMVLPVIDMRRYFNLAQCDRSERQRIIVLNLGGVLTGYIVDSVTEVLRVTRSELTPPPTLNSEAARYVKHVAKARGGKAMVLVLESAAFDAVTKEQIQQQEEMEHHEMSGDA